MLVDHHLPAASFEERFEGVYRKKPLVSDVWLTTRFSLQIALYLLVKQKENLTLYQV